MTLKNRLRVVLVIITFGVVLMTTGMGQAENLLSGPESLQELIHEALLQNKNLRGIEARIESLREASVAAGSLADPRVGMALLNLPAVSLNFKQEPMTQKQVFIAQKFPWPGKLDLKSQVVLVEAEKLEKRLFAEKLKIARKIAEAYYGLGVINEGLLINGRLDELMEQLVNVASAKYASGRGSRQDLLQARVERLKLSDERVNLLKKYRMKENGIHLLLNSDTYAPIAPPAAPDIKDIKERVQVLKKKAEKENTGLGIRSADLKQTRVKLALARKDYYPDIDVKLSYGQRDQDRAGNDLDDFISLAATINLPLWKKTKQDRNLLSVKAGERSAGYSLSALRREIPYRADLLAVDILESLKRLELYRQAIIPEAREWGKSALHDYEVGNIEYASMIRANILPLRMELEEKRLLYDLFKKQAALEELAGGAL